MQVEVSGAEPRVGSSFDTNHATIPGFGGGSIGGSVTDQERENPSRIEIRDGGDAPEAENCDGKTDADGFNAEAELTKLLLGQAPGACKAVLDFLKDYLAKHKENIEISDGGDDAAANERAANGGEFVAVSEAAGASEERLLLRLVEANIRMQETLMRLLEKSPSAASRASSTAASLNTNCEKVRIALTSRIVDLEEGNAKLVKRNAELEVRNADLEKRVKAWADKEAARRESNRIASLKSKAKKRAKVK